MSDRSDGGDAAGEADEAHRRSHRGGGGGRGRSDGSSPGDGRRRECGGAEGGGEEGSGPLASPPPVEGDGPDPRGPRPRAPAPDPVPRREAGRAGDGRGGGDGDDDSDAAIHGVPGSGGEGPAPASTSTGETGGGAEMEEIEMEAHYVFLVHGWLGIDRELSYLEEALTRQHAIAVASERSRRRPSGRVSGRGGSGEASIPRAGAADHDYNDGVVEGDEGGEEVDVVVHKPTCNHGRTSDGIARGGTRLAGEVTDFIEADVRRRLQLRHRRQRQRRPISRGEGDHDDDETIGGAFHVTISFVGYSLGGMYSRYAISVLPPRLHVDVPIATEKEEEGEMGAPVEGVTIRLHPRVFCTAATPHLGIASNTYVLLPRAAERILGGTMGRTGRDLFRINAPGRARRGDEGRRRWSGCTCRGGDADVESTPPESAAAAPAATSGVDGATDHPNVHNDDRDLVYAMTTSPKFTRPLSLFHLRIAYANAFATDFQVPVSTAAFLSGESRYPQRLISDRSSPSSDLDDDRHGLIASVFRTNPTDPDAGGRKHALASSTTTVPEPPKSRKDELLAMSASLDSLGWTKVFCDVRAGVPLPGLSLPAACRRPRREKLRSFIDERRRQECRHGNGGGGDGSGEGGEVDDVTLESREVLRLVRRGDAVLHVPMGHAVMVAHSKTTIGARLHSRGRPVMDRLASELLRELEPG